MLEPLDFGKELFTEDGFREIQDDEVFGSASRASPTGDVGILATRCYRGQTYDFCMPEKTIQPA